MQPPRIRVRALMLAVGVVALLLWCGTLGIRSCIDYQRARFYGIQERAWREGAARARGNPAAARTIEAVYGTRNADYYALLVKTYRRAMWRPWIPLAPDPHAPGYDQWVEQERRKASMPDPR